MIAGVVLDGRAAATASRSREITGHGAGVPSRRARLGGQGQGRRARTAACSTATTSRAPASARARGPRATATQRRFDGRVTADHVEQQQLRQGRAGEPVLISLDDAETLFHEFGHALHGLLQDVSYPGLAGTPRDFVEYPVAGARELGADARRARQLRAPLPDRRSRCRRRWSTRSTQSRSSTRATPRSSTCPPRSSTWTCTRVADGVVDPDAFERDTLARIGMPREVAMRHRLPQFNHLFTSDAYSAGLLQLPVVRGDGRRHVGGVRRSRRTLGQDRGEKAAAVSSWRPATRSIAPRPTASSAAAIPTSRRCSRSAASRQAARSRGRTPSRPLPVDALTPRGAPQLLGLR